MSVDRQGDLVRWPLNEAEEIVSSDQLDTPYRPMEAARAAFAGSFYSDDSGIHGRAAQSVEASVEEAYLSNTNRTGMRRTWQTSKSAPPECDRSRPRMRDRHRHRDARVKRQPQRTCAASRDGHSDVRRCDDRLHLDMHMTMTLRKPSQATPEGSIAVRPRIEPPLILEIGELENRQCTVPVTFSRGLLHTPQAPRP